MMVDAEVKYVKLKIEYTMRFQHFLNGIPFSGGKFAESLMVYERYEPAKERIVAFLKQMEKIFHKKLRVKNKSSEPDDAFSDLEAVKRELEIIKQDIDFMKTTLVSSNSLETISRISEQVQAINNDNSTLKSMLDEILQKINSR
jgi:hypothetical protein